MTNCESILSNVQNVCSEIAVAKKNEVMVSCQKCIVESDSCTLNNVLYVPNLSKDLLLFPTIKNGGNVLFTGNKVEVRKSGIKILEGCQNGSGCILLSFLILMIELMCNITFNRPKVG